MKMQPDTETVSRETLSRLETYQALLTDWQGRMNLVSRNSLPDAWVRHFEDSIQLAPFVSANAKTLYDLGSGAGFPGLVLAILRPDLDVHLIESTGKKCRFLEAAAQATHTPVVVHNARIEAVAKSMAAPDVITARALAPLEELLDLCAPWIRANPALVLVFPKGEKNGDEIAAARKRWQFDVEAHLSRTEEAARIVVLRNVRPA